MVVNDDLLTTLADMAFLLALGVMIPLILGKRVPIKWILAAVLLFLVHDFLVFNGFGLIPKLIDGLARNWQGKLLALLFTLAVASHEGFGLRNCGITLAQTERGRPLTYGVAITLLVGIALWAATGDKSQWSAENALFQMTMPGLEEETFYRGVLLFALSKAFPESIRGLGVSVGWGAVLVAIMFGFGHGFYFSGGALVMDWWLAVNTGITGAFLLWLRLRTGSIVLPVVVHNTGNLMPLLVAGLL